jgi:hypothetical protein
MSKILRRPMFRGGPVNSEGTGITSGLDEGYATGGRVGYQRAGFVGDSGDYTYEPSQSVLSEQEKFFGSKDDLLNRQTPDIYKEHLGSLEDKSTYGFFDVVGKALNPFKTSMYSALRPTEEMSKKQQELKFATSPAGKENIISDIERQKQQRAEQIMRDPKASKYDKELASVYIRPDGGETVTKKEIGDISLDDVDARTEKYAKLLGYDKAKTQSIYDAMLAASPAFFKGRSFGETASGVLEAVNKSGAFDKPTNIKQAAAQLAIQREILIDKAKSEATAKMAELGYKKPGTLGERYTAYVKGGTDPEMAKEFSIREAYGDAYKPYEYQYGSPLVKKGDIYKVKNPKGGTIYIEILDPKSNRPGIGYKQLL